MDTGVATNEVLTLNNIDHGRHICSIYKTIEEQFSPIAPFFANGVKNNQKCVYVYNDIAPSRIFDDLEALGVPTDNLKSTKQIEFVSKHDSYLLDGHFDSDRMIKTTENFVQSSLKQNYNGIRAAGDMSWSINEGLNMEKLIEYESDLNNFYPNFQISGICQYDENMFSKDVLIGVIRTHPYLIIYGKFYKNKYFYTPPEYIKNEIPAAYAAGLL